MIKKISSYYTLQVLKKTSKIILLIITLNISLFILILALTHLPLKSYLRSTKIKETLSHVSGEDYYKFLQISNFYFAKSTTAPPSDLFTISTILYAITNVTASDHRSLFGNELPGFREFDSKIILAGDGTNYTNMPFESEPIPELLILSEKNSSENNSSETVTPEILTEGDKVHIYFTHTRESYIPESGSDTNTEINVTHLGSHLQNLLQNKGIGTSIDKTDVIDIILGKSAKYATAYNESRELLVSALRNNTNLTYVIDIHRDSQPRNITTIPFNDQEYAKIAFIIGGNNPNYEQNTILAEKIHERMNAKVPGISRGIFSKSGPGTNGIYNQDLSENAMLIEIGGVENTLEEAKRCIEVFAAAFSDYFWETRT